jgi:hypoxanthine phosphoribosyltransferase
MLMQYIVSDFSESVEVPEAGIMMEEDSAELPRHLTGIDKVLITENCIRARVRGIAQEINQQYKNKTIHCVVVLSGAIVFFSDLMRALSRFGFTITYSVVKLSSYSKTESSGTIDVELGHDNMDGKDVVIIEDIVDTGLTLNFVKDNLKNAKSIKTCVLFDKHARRKHTITLDFTGFKVPNKFLVGYGLDYEQKYRELPFVGVLKS